MFRFRGYTYNSGKHHELIKKEGRRAGQQGYPSKDSADTDFFEGRLHREAEHILTNTINAMDKRLQHTEQAVRHHYEALRRDLVLFKEENSRLNHKTDTLRRGVIRHLRLRTYILITVLISLAEFALNFQVFQVFRRPMLDTMLMALIPGVTIPVIAHFLGIFVRQNNLNFRNLLVACGVIVVIIFSFLKMNQLRVAYLTVATPGQAVAMRSLEGAFVFVNILIFAAVFIMSIAHHDQDPELERLEKSVAKLYARCSRHAQQLTLSLGAMDDQGRDIELSCARVSAAYKSCVNIYRFENELARDEQHKSEPNKGTKREIIQLEPPKLTDGAAPPSAQAIQDLRDDFVRAQGARPGEDPQGVARKTPEA